MASTSTPSHAPFLRGVLVGLSPLLILFMAGCVGCLLGIVSAGMGGGPDEFTSIAAEGMDGGPVERAAPPAPPLPRIDPATPLAGLLPTPPGASKASVYLGDDLSCVLELMLEAAPPLTTDEWRSRKAHTAAAALHLNKQEEDGFLKTLVRTRPDLAGVPFVMGADCRTTGDRAKAFKEAAEGVRGRNTVAALLVELPEPDPEEEKRLEPNAGQEKRRQSDQAHLAVITQVMPAQPPAARGALVRTLSSIPTREATRALARLAVFSADGAVRAAATEALAVRREDDATDTLVAGLRYPWPAVAGHAATAIAKLKRKDLVPQLRAALDAPDPRGPRAEVVAGRQETVAYELVRVNHLRNCLLCHAPAERGTTQDETLVAEVPVPTESLPDTSAGYGQSESPLLVRVDVTYLRQDFSAMQKVTDWSADSWSSTQRFDFFVRRRVLTRAEAADLRTRLAGESPYRRAAARALRELTGRDFEVGAGAGPRLL